MILGVVLTPSFDEKLDDLGRIRRRVDVRYMNVLERDSMHWHYVPKTAIRGVKVRGQNKAH
jgi:hypothetical protein